MLYPVGYNPVSKISNSLVWRDLTDSDVPKLEEKITFCKARDCIDKMLNHKNAKWKGNPKTIKKKVIIRFDIKLIAHNADRVELWVVLQKLNRS